ncbi:MULTISPECIES: hypothetical protein [Fischerella]|nr:MULTISPECIES: hypothetical protein [Fischerella]
MTYEGILDNNPTTLDMVKVQIIIFDGFDELDAIAHAASRRVG